MSESVHDGRSLLAQLYASCRSPLLRFLQHRLGDRHAAEDALQESFTRFAASNAATAPDKERPYLFQIAANLLHDQARERQRRGGDMLSLDDQQHGAQADAAISPAPTPAAAAEHRQRLARLQEALAELPERQRQAFVLHRFDGLTQDEVAQQMGISRRMVTKHLARALAYCQLRVQYASQQQMRAHLPDSAAALGEDQ